MNKNEKAVATNNGFNQINEQLTMDNSTLRVEKTQINFDFGKPPKLVFQTITCYDCKESRELDGYRFALVAICDCCRTKEELRVLNNRIDRRRK